MSKLPSLIKIGSSSLFVVNPNGSSGGLELLWRDDIEVEIQNYSSIYIYINAIISMARSNIQ
jgi:hypothetical protein